MNSRVERKTVDLSPFPDLVVIYLGMRVNALTGVKTLFGFGPQIKNAVAARKFYYVLDPVASWHASILARL
jgi:hypothetical protein